MTSGDRIRKTPLQLSVQDLLEALASRHVSAAAGGAAAAVTAAAAAALTTKAARASLGTWIEAGGAVAQAEALRAQAQALVVRDVDVYLDAIRILDRVQPTRSARGGPGGPRGRPMPAAEREHAIQEALELAAEVPLTIAEVASEIAVLAAEVASVCAPAARPDAVIAATLAESAATSAGVLVRINRLVAADDPRCRRVDRAVFAATAARERSLQTLLSPEA